MVLVDRIVKVRELEDAKKIITERTRSRSSIIVLCRTSGKLLFEMLENRWSECIDPNGDYNYKQNKTIRFIPKEVTVHPSLFANPFLSCPKYVSIPLWFLVRMKASVYAKKTANLVIVKWHNIAHILAHVVCTWGWTHRNTAPMQIPAKHITFASYNKMRVCNDNNTLTNVWAPTRITQIN